MCMAPWNRSTQPKTKPYILEHATMEKIKKKLAAQTAKKSKKVS